MALGGGSGMRGGGRGLLITLALSAVLLLVLVSDVGARQDSHTGILNFNPSSIYLQLRVAQLGGLSRLNHRSITSL